MAWHFQRASCYQLFIYLLLRLLLLEPSYLRRDSSIVPSLSLIPASHFRVPVSTKQPYKREHGSREKHETGLERKRTCASNCEFSPSCATNHGIYDFDDCLDGVLRISC
eukprot:TRINITY_DN43132_c0_g1_i5.p1 TRINITY_DN43132_c0_g1~~TRINITY_DN43132_c0_g1_i5.p1  ORF type:complete len:109 (+),score=4.01 TRINITY_DN43132_c0_g1_i5:441-767(+)